MIRKEPPGAGCNKVAAGAALAALVIVWWRLLNNLRVEWTLNPQYGYGWVVPFLCWYLAWQRIGRGAGGGEPRQGAGRVWRAALIGLGMMWLGIRLVQEANPEWRLVSWALAVAAIGLTLMLADALPFGKIRGRRAELVFPLSFILLAVPWPSVVEEPLTQVLSRATAGLTTEALNLAGTPAAQRGNWVEVGAGILGIEEGCSGIRSLQAALMVSVFLGGAHRLGLAGRLGLVLAGMVLAFGFNLARTSVLALVMATGGAGASKAWHDPLSVLFPLGCFGWLSFLAWREGKAEARQKGCSEPRVRGGLENHVPGSGRREEAGLVSDSEDSHLRRAATISKRGVRECGAGTNGQGNWVWGVGRTPGWIGPAVVTWLVVVEGATRAWYGLHEARQGPPARWRMEVPAGTAGLEEKLPSAKAKQMLRFDGGQDARWEDAAGRSWQAIFLEWNAGRIAGRLARDHTPGVCLRAGGRRLLGEAKSRVVAIGGLRQRVYLYTASDERRGKVHLLYCVGGDQGLEGSPLECDFLWQERLGAVIRGRRSGAQRSLELAVWGMDQEEAAWEELSGQLQRIARIDSPAEPE